MRQLFLAAGLILATVGAARAEEIPDLTGRWTFTAEAVGFTFDKYGVSEETAFRTFESTVDFDRQDGRRVAGHEVDHKVSSGPDPIGIERVVAVIGHDNKSVYMVDENGFRDCVILDADTMSCVYRHTLEHRSDISVGYWKRQK
ncbi:hypothetical protein [Chachezhania sediminis]|uniref:hypothetical protein n=1 Tax=Chachezhania sediminis TaxID=2599291 RepID=UPI00131C2AFB|nr:hypothetical protein [Chachezhania sediminis]